MSGDAPEPTRLPTASVVICAYTLDRWPDLVAGFAGLAAQTVPPHEVLLVIDHHDELLRRADVEFGRRPRTRVLANDRSRGASGARNAGIARATGEVVVFLDDDAAPDPDWLAHLLAPYADPRVHGVGGYADPVWPAGGRPAQLVPELDWIIGCTYRGQPTELAEVRNLVACNMSVRRSVFDRVGTFDEEVGRIGRIPLGCEETELCIRLGRDIPGARLLFEPRARVHHRVTEQRRTWGYLRSRSFAEGLSKAAMARVVGAQDATSVEKDYVRRVLVGAVAREVRRGLRGHPEGWRGAGGILLSLAAAGVGYLRGRSGVGAGTMSRLARRERDAS